MKRVHYFIHAQRYLFHLQVFHRHIIDMQLCTDKMLICSNEDKNLVLPRLSADQRAQANCMVRALVILSRVIFALSGKTINVRDR